MADNVHASSRSRKQRRSRTNRKKSKKCTAVTQHDPIEAVGDTDNVIVRELSDCEPLEGKMKEIYRVESPITVPVEKKTHPMVKSRSLDDEDQVKIMEVTDELQVKSASESIAIVSEAESDVEWETVSDFADEKTLQQIGKLSVISLPLEEQRLFEPSNISPEDERSLRDFLKGLDLVNSAEESVKRIEKPSTSDSAKARKAKKRAALVQHFLPYYQNPRYLDVISEEGSDINDKDTKKNPFARPQFTENDYDEEDDVFVDVQKKMRQKFQSVYADSQEGAILVDTKLLEHDYPMMKEATWSTSIAETRSGAEVVYLEDSSSSMTPSDLLDLEDTVDADDEEDISIDLDKSFSDNFEFNSTESASLANTDVSITLSKECAQDKAEPTPPSSSVDISANGVEEHPEIDQPSNKTTIDFLQRLSLASSENSTEENHILTNDEKCFDLPRNSIDLSNQLDEKIKYLQDLINNVNADNSNTNVQDTPNEINLEELNSSDVHVEKWINGNELNTTDTIEILKLNDILPEITNRNIEETSLKDKENKINDNLNEKAPNILEPKEHIINVELLDGTKNIFEESNKENAKHEKIYECIQESKTTTKEHILNVVDEISNTIKECSRRDNLIEIKTINEEENRKEESHKTKEHLIKIELLDKVNKIKETNIEQEKLIDEKKCKQASNKKEHIIKVELEDEINNKNKELKKIINENTRVHESSKKEHIIKVELLDDVSNKMKTNVTKEKKIDENKVMHTKEQIIKVELLHEDHKIKESNNIKDAAKERKLLRDNQSMPEINSTKEHIIKVELEDEIGNQIKDNIKRNKIQEESNKIKERIIKVELLDEVSNEIKQFNLKSETVKEKSTDVKLSKASTQNDNELNKELKQLCESLLKTRSDEYSNTTETSRPESADSACSSSRSTSQCTAFYNPVHSSLTNIAAMLREGSFDGRVSPDVATLRELCIKTLLSMPFGKDIIQELATVSLSLEEMACQNPPLQSPPNIPTKPNTKSPSPLIPAHNKIDDDDDDSLLVSSTINLPVAPPKMDAEKWIGMPTEIDPNVLLCLSPSQKDFIETTKTVPKEADSLLDLHRKYIERRGYHEAYEMFKPTPQKEVRTVQIKIQPRSENKLLTIIQNDNSAQNMINYNNYLKTFTREIPIQVTKSTDAEMKKETNITNGNIRYDTYIKQLTREVPIQVERQIHKPVNNKIYEGAFESEHTKTDRLNARRLSEWLNLARTSDCADKINNFKEDFNRNCNLQSSVNKLVSQRICDEHHSHSTTTTTTTTAKRSTSPRRYSLPFNLYEQQMQYILEKEREIENEIEKLREEKAKLEKCEDDTVTTKESINNSVPSNKQFDAGKYQISRKGDIAILQDSPNEKFREQMYNEYMCKVAERQERKQNKVIKIKITTKPNEQSTSELSPQCDVKHTSGLEDEFIKKVKERMDKLGLNEESYSDEDKKNGENSCDAEPVLVMDGGSVAAAKKLPKHLQEFVDFTRTTAASSDDGVWTPGNSGEAPTPAPRPIKIEFKPPKERSPPKEAQKSDEPAPVVWTPRSAGSSPTAERKEFKPVTFESPVLSRKNKSKETTPVVTPEAGATLQQPPWEGGKVTTAESSHTLQESTVTSTLERRLTTSHSAPTAGLNNLSKLPRAQNPTITLLQKAREGQLPRGASYIEQQTQHQSIPKHRSKDERPPFIGPNEILYTVKNEYMSESDSEKPKKMANLGPRKFEGIGPTTKDGMPIVLRSEVKDGNQAKWYKQMYDTLHRAKNDDEYVTVRYKTRRGRYPYTSAGGYLSEPEPNAYDSDAAISASKYATLDRRRLQPNRDKENEYITYTVPRNKYMSASVKHSTDVYKNQPGRIENYIPGHSSISEKEAKEHLEQQKHVPPQTKSYMSHALKESGYESDSTLVFRRREDAALQLSPHEQKEVYKNIQKGGDVPLHGLRKLAPERPKEPELGPTPPPKGRIDFKDFGPESPRKYVEDEVTIHYRSPVRHEIKEMISEEELARKQAEAMRRIYQEERRRKYLQELQDMNSRRHTDNFIPSQKSPIPLNRYDDFIDNVSMKMKPRDQSPEPRLVARAIYNFVGQSSRELTFRKGDVIFIRRQVDKNWYEGEHNAMIGLFPSNYVEIVPYDGIKSTPRKAHEGQARAKFNFIAQTHLELSLAKGELVVLTRRVDDNWYEGRIGSRKGIFPVSYIDVLIDPSDKQESIPSGKPVASPAAHSLLLNGSSGGKESMGSHHYQPSYSPQPTTTSYHAKPVNVIGTSSSYHSLTRTQKLTTPSVNEALHIDTHSEPVPYRALYKYKPQNDDELELLEGDTVYVLEKCDDGWYVGSSQRTGAFGTFPGNYVERI